MYVYVYMYTWSRHKQPWLSYLTRFVEILPLQKQGITFKDNFERNTWFCEEAVEDFCVRFVVKEIVVELRSNLPETVQPRLRDSVEVMVLNMKTNIEGQIIDPLRVHRRCWLVLAHVVVFLYVAHA